MADMATRMTVKRSAVQFILEDVYARASKVLQAESNEAERMELSQYQDRPYPAKPFAGRGHL